MNKKQPTYTHCKVCKKKLGPGRDHRFGVCGDHVNEGLTFKQYLNILEEDVAADVAKLQGDIAMIDAKLNQQSKPLLDRKNQLTKLLAVKQKQKETENRKMGTQDNTQQQNKQQPAGQPRQNEMIARSTSQPSPPQ